jgi:DNA-directed RNA polymerase subunit F
VEVYNSVLFELLEKHAPLKQKEIVIHPNSPWYNSDIAEAKRARRKAEKKWCKSKLTVDYQIYVEAREHVNLMIDQAKAGHYRTKIEEAGDQKTLFKVVDDLLHNKTATKLPSCESDLELANKFNDFFATKITKLRDQMSSNTGTGVHLHQPEMSSQIVHELSDFRPATENEVEKVIKSSKSKQCKLDPIPTQLLKECLEALLPTITKLVNLSLEMSTMPANLKKALVTPLLKKAVLDLEIFKHYRPVSNLAFISKVVERIVAIRVREHMDINDLHESFQSAYKSLHSTETALLRVQDDILCALDQRKCILLVLLDCSAAFDTIDHDVLINRLASVFGIKGKALKWFRSYLLDRLQSVTINGVESDMWNLIFGVPQGSVLGPILFIIYTTPLGEILRRHSISFHLYADDSQLYLAFKLPDREDAYSQMESCIDEIRVWMSANFLCFNDSKTEVIFFGSKHNLKAEPQIPLKVGNELITPTASARNIGVLMDQSMSMQVHIANICKSAWQHLRQIGMIRKHLDDISTERIIHAFVSSKLDHQNGLLYGVPTTQLLKLQRIQNAAARLITRSKKHEHATPLLETLHWLPIRQRINFKILLFIYKCLNNLAPIYLSELIEPLIHTRSLRSTNLKLLKCPKSNTSSYGDRSFSHAGPMLWNRLPLEIRESETVDIFKSALKTHIFREEYCGQ